MDVTTEPASLIDWNNTPIVNSISKPLIPLPPFDGNFEINQDNPFDDVERQIHDVFSPTVSVVAGNRDDNFIDSLIRRMEKMRLYNTSVIETCSNMLHDGQLIERNDSTSKSLFPSDIPNSSTNTSPWNISNLLQIRSKVASFMNQIPEDVKFKNQSASNGQNNLISLCQENVSEDEAFNNCFVASTTDESRFSSSSKMRVSSESDILTFYDEFLMGQSFEDIRSIVPCWEEMTLYSSSDEENESALNFSVYSENSQTPLSLKHMSLRVEKLHKLQAPLIYQEPNIRVKKTNYVTKQGPLKAVIPVASMKGVSQNNLRNAPSSSKKSTLPLKTRRRSAPVATSTPQSIRGTSLNSSLSTPVKYLSTSKLIRPRAPSPDSTSGPRIKSKIGLQSKLMTKNQRIPCSPVSSSTNLSFPRSASKTTKNMKNSSSTDLSKGCLEDILDGGPILTSLHINFGMNMLMGGKSRNKAVIKSRSIHNKENLSPFQI